MSAEDKQDALIGRWIIDYHSRAVWKKFEQNGTVDSTYQSICQSQASDKSTSVSSLLPVDDVELRSRLLIELMYKLANGRELFSASLSGGPPKKTILEEAIDVLDKLVRDTNAQEFVTLADVTRTKLAIRRQAVFVCCRADNFALAASVFVRQWTQPGSDREKDMRQRVAQVVSEKNRQDPRLGADPYSSMIDESCAFLRKIFSSLSMPFLVKAAKNVCEKIEGMAEQDPSGMKIAVKAEPSSSFTARGAMETNQSIARGSDSGRRGRGRKKSIPSRNDPSPKTGVVRSGGRGSRGGRKSVGSGAPTRRVLSGGDDAGSPDKVTGDVKQTGTLMLDENDDNDDDEDDDDDDDEDFETTSPRVKRRKSSVGEPS